MDTNKKNEIIKCYYRSSDLNQYQNLGQTILFGSRLFNIPIGNGLFTLSLFEQSMSNGKIDVYVVENTVFFLNDPLDENNKNCIYFTISTFNTTTKNKFNPNTNLTYQITGGSGKYLGASGIVNFLVDSDGVRNVTIDVFY
jgi:hypothetical protein